MFQEEAVMPQEYQKEVFAAVDVDNIFVFADLEKRYSLRFGSALYRHMAKMGAIKIFNYIFNESMSPDARKSLIACRKLIQDPADAGAGAASKRSAVRAKPIPKFVMSDYTNIPQEVFSIALENNRLQFLAFMFASGVPICITTYHQFREGSKGYCSAFFSAMNKQCAPNNRKISGILAVS